MRINDESDGGPGGEAEGAGGGGYPGSGDTGGGAAGGLATEAGLRLGSPVEVVAAVPYLLGFHPRDSMVLVSIGDRRISLAARIDLPPAEETAEVARELAAVVAERHCDEVLVVIVGGAAGAADVDRAARGAPVRPDLVAAVRSEFHGLGIPVSASIWVPEVAAGVSWRCYDSDSGGVLPDPSASAVAAATVAAGQVTYSDRRDIERLVAPDAPGDLERRSRLLEALCDRLCEEQSLDDPDPGADSFALVRTWIDRAGSGSLDLGDGDVVALCVALSDPMVRDAAFGFAEGPEAAAAERLWTALVRAAPAPEVAEPAVLLAHCALARGNGALVGIALERALLAWPGHRMSGMLRAALDGGLGPDDLLGWFTEGAHEARRLLRLQGVR